MFHLRFGLSDHLKTLRDFVFGSRRRVKKVRIFRAWFSHRSFINFHGQGSSTRFHVIWVRFSVSWTDTDSSNSILRKWGRHVHKHQKTPPAKDYNVLSGKLQKRERWLRLVPAKDYNALSGLTRSNQNTPQRATTPCWHLEPKGYGISVGAGHHFLRHEGLLNHITPFQKREEFR